MKMGKIFVFINTYAPGNYISYAISEDGVILSNHLSSSEEWAKHDMGITSPWKHEEYNAHYPQGWEIEFVSYENVASHNELQKAFEIYKKNNPKSEGAEWLC